MLTRLSQLVAKLVAAVAVPLFVWLGADEEAIGLVIEQSAVIGGALVALIALVADLLLHRAETGGVMQRAGSKKTKSNHTHLPILPLPALLVVLLTGCANPLQKPAENLVETVFPEHRAYVEADDSLLPVEKDVRLDLLDAFEKTVDMGRDQPATILPPPAPRE